MSIEIKVTELVTPFKVVFRHAAAERAAAQSVWVEARIGTFTGIGEGCPREYVTGENTESALKFIREVSNEIASIDSMDMLQDFVTANRARIDQAPAAWCAVELAVLDCLAQRELQPVEALLKLPSVAGDYRYTAVLGDSPDAVFATQLQQFQALGFRDFKLKVSGNPQRDAERIQAIQAFPEVRLRLDANNLWPDVDSLATWCRQVVPNVVAIEEPLASSDLQEMRAAADLVRAPIILDEHFSRLEQLRTLSDDPARWILNIRISKMGGLLRSLEIAAAARDAKIRMVVGAQVGETSVLTRAALPVARASGEWLIGQEGAFGEHLLDRDQVEPVLQFGSTGILEISDIASDPGWGLSRRA